MAGTQRRKRRRRSGGVPGFREAVEAAVRSLRTGEVVSYGEVAEQAGFPGAARGVGGVLRDPGEDVPWWRVVAADGRIVCPSAGEQASRLKAEGVAVVNGRVRHRS